GARGLHAPDAAAARQRGVAIHGTRYADLRRPLRAGARGARSARRRLGPGRDLATDPRVAPAANESPPLFAREVASGHGARMLLPGADGRRPDEARSVGVDDHEAGPVARELRVPPLPRIAGEGCAELLPRLGVPELCESVGTAGGGEGR